MISSLDYEIITLQYVYLPIINMDDNMFCCKWRLKMRKAVVLQGGWQIIRFEYLSFEKNVLIRNEYICP